MSVKDKIKSTLILLSSFLCVGCPGKIEKNQNEANVGNFSSLPIIKDYLNQKVASKGFGGNAYCAYEVLDAAKDGSITRLYLWTVCQEYYRKNQNLEKGTGGSFPVALTIQTEKEKIEVLSHQTPRDGSYYTSDLVSIFSKKAFASAKSMNNERVAQLQKAVEQEAEAN